MNAQTLLLKLQEVGAHISVRGDDLVVRVRPGGLTAEVVAQLKAQKSELQYLIAGLQQAGKRGSVRLERRGRLERLPLSYGQQRLWFIDQLEKTSTEYNGRQGLRLRGKLNREALERAINEIVKRHESLRTRFEEVDGEPVQVIEAEMRIEMPVEDVSEMEECEQEERVKAALREEVFEAFDLSRGPLLRVRLIRLGEQEYVLLRTMHHIVSDAWSQAVFNRELAVLYEAFAAGRENPLKPLEVQYADFTLWQREWMESGALEEGLGYWKRQLEGIPEQLELPTDRARPAVQTFKAERCEVVLGEGQVAGLKRLSERHGVTLYMSMLAAFGVLLGRYSGQEDVVVGSPIANRQDAKLEDLIGFFVNSLVMRLRVRREMSFRELLEQVRKTALEAYEHQDIPFERLVEELSPQRSLNRAPVFQVVFAVQNAPREAQRLKGLELEPVPGDELRVHFDLVAHVWEGDGRLAIGWLYNRDLFEGWRIEQMLGHYVRILDAMVADSGQVVGRVEVLSEEERHRLLVEWNDSEMELLK